MTFKAFITGCAGRALSARERSFLRRERPVGLILFERNIATPEQVRSLIKEFKHAVQSDQVMILVDQEGGRIQRFRPPHWRQLPSMRQLGNYHLAHPDKGPAAAWLIGRLLAHEMISLGVNVNCTPVLDVPASGAHDIIGNRAFSNKLDVVINMGRAIAKGHMAGGVLPVIKHIPGHGRAGADSHEQLPVIDADIEALRRVDFAAFHALRDMPIAMTAHVLLPRFDPEHPVSTSAKIIGEIIRGEIGFEGLLLSDDLSMGALSGDLGARSAAVIEAGCDIALHCNGDFNEMTQVAANVPPLSGRRAERFEQAFGFISDIEPLDLAKAEAVVTAVCQMSDELPNEISNTE